MRRFRRTVSATALRTHARALSPHRSPVLLLPPNAALRQFALRADSVPPEILLTPRPRGYACLQAPCAPFPQTGDTRIRRRPGCADCRFLVFPRFPAGSDASPLRTTAVPSRPYRRPRALSDPYTRSPAAATQPAILFSPFAASPALPRAVPPRSCSRGRFPPNRDSAKCHGLV